MVVVESLEFVISFQFLLLTRIDLVSLFSLSVSVCNLSFEFDMDPERHGIRETRRETRRELSREEYSFCSTDYNFEEARILHFILSSLHQQMLSDLRLSFRLLTCTSG